MNGISAARLRLVELPTDRVDVDNPVLYVNPAYVVSIEGSNGPDPICMLNMADGKRYQVDLPADEALRRLLQVEV